MRVLDCQGQVRLGVYTLCVRRPLDPLSVFFDGACTDGQPIDITTLLPARADSIGTGAYSIVLPTLRQPHRTATRSEQVHCTDGLATTTDPIVRTKCAGPSPLYFQSAPIGLERV